MANKYFESRYRFFRGRARVWKAICEYLQRDVPRTAAVLDLGAGYCDFINQIHAAGRYALDANPDVRKYCGKDVTFICSELEEIPLPDASIDVVFASNLLEHLSDARLACLFAHLDRILKPSGTLILIQPNYYYCYRTYWDDFTHVKAYSHQSLPDMLHCSGYKVLRVEKRFLPFSFGTVSIHSYYLTRLYLALTWRPFAAQMLVVARREAERA